MTTSLRVSNICIEYNKQVNNNIMSLVIILTLF